jgi:hypothetical protein
VADILTIARGECGRLQLEATRHPIDLFRLKIDYMKKIGDYVVEMRALRETIEGEIAHRYFYGYRPPSKMTISQCGSAP